jgi:hypothetical protein
MSGILNLLRKQNALVVTFSVSRFDTKKRERENFLKNFWLVETYEPYRVTS